MVSGGTSLAVFGSSMALIVAGTDKSKKVKEHKSIRARNDLFVSAAFFIFLAFLDKKHKFGFPIHLSALTGNRHRYKY
jgi:hypothetical protein